jgi:translocator protein
VNTASVWRASTPDRVHPTWRDPLGLFLSFALALGVAGISAIASMGSLHGWYAHAHTTLWSPPNIVFGPVWLVLYSIMAVAAWQVWRSPASADREKALGLYTGQLALNAGWTPLFFIGFDVIGPIALWIAVVWIVVLNFVVLATLVVMWRVSKSASVLMMPYWA